jgi:hypothetical protein
MTDSPGNKIVISPKLNLSHISWQIRTFLYVFVTSQHTNLQFQVTVIYETEVFHIVTIVIFIKLKPIRVAYFFNSLFPYKTYRALYIEWCYCCSHFTSLFGHIIVVDGRELHNLEMGWPQMIRCSQN